MKSRPAIVLRGLPVGGYPASYRATLSHHATVAGALAWGALSGLSAVPKGPCVRPGRLWIERQDAPATLESR